MIDYLFGRYNRKTQTEMIAKVYDTLFCYFDEEKQFNFLCSWFCNTDVNFINEWGLDLDNFHFYDFDETVYSHNKKITENCYLNDVIFDDLSLNGIFINRYAEYTYPIGKIYKGDLLIVGNDDKQLYLPNSIDSCQMIIDQNKFTSVWYTEQWSVIREYDKKQINYYLVAGCNI